MRVILYRITNLVNGKIYIGQTSKSISQRWSRHCWRSEKNKNMAISQAILNYGRSSFKIEQIDEANSYLESNKKERELIAKYNSLAPNGYNLSVGGENKGMTEETRRKISEANKGKLISEETRKRLSDSHKGIRMKKETKEKLSKSNSGKKPSKQTVRGAVEKLSKRYRFISPNGETVEIFNMNQFCRDNHLLPSCMNMVASGKQSHHKKWRLAQ